MLRKAFCGFAVHAAKSDESLKGLRSSIRQRFLDKLKRPVSGRLFNGTGVGCGRGSLRGGAGREDTASAGP